jgi:transcriptional regulator
VSPVEILPGTLDLLVLKAVSLGSQHGYGILLRIGQISGGHLPVQQGTLYPALYRLEDRGLLAAEWGVSGNNRRAKFYSLTPAGRKQLRDERSSWEQVVAGMTAALRATPEAL